MKTFDLDTIKKYHQTLLSEDEMVAVAYAIKHDEMTRDIYDGYIKFLKSATDEDLQKSVYRVRSKIQEKSDYQQIWKIAVAVLVIILPLTYFIIKDEKPQFVDKPIIEKKDTLPQEKVVVSVDTSQKQKNKPSPIVKDKPVLFTPDAIPMVAFNENAEYELLVNNYVRSSAVVSNVTPRTNQKTGKGQTVNFSYTTFARTKKHRVSSEI